MGCCIRGVSTTLCWKNAWWVQVEIDPIAGGEEPRTCSSGRHGFPPKEFLIARGRYPCLVQGLESTSCSLLDPSRLESAPFPLGSSFRNGWTWDPTVLCGSSVSTKQRPGRPPEDGPRNRLVFEWIEISIVVWTHRFTTSVHDTTRTRAWTRGIGFERPCRKENRGHTRDENLVHAWNRCKRVQKKENQRVRRRTGSATVVPTPTKPKRIPRERPKDPRRREKTQE